MARGMLSNSLLGRVLRKHPQANEMMWPPNWSPSYREDKSCIGVIEAAWVEDGNVKVAIRNIMDGQIAEVFLTHHILEAQ